MVNGQLQLAMGVLHQHSRWNCFDSDDAGFVFDPPYLRQGAGAKVDYWGIGMLALWVGALQVVLDKGQQEDWFSSHFIHGFHWITVICPRRFSDSRAATRAPVVNLKCFKRTGPIVRACF